MTALLVIGQTGEWVAIRFSGALHHQTDGKSLILDVWTFSVYASTTLLMEHIWACVQCAPQVQQYISSVTAVSLFLSTYKSV